jgi:hypothetical protein
MASSDVVLFTTYALASCAVIFLAAHELMQAGVRLLRRGLRYTPRLAVILTFQVRMMAVTPEYEPWTYAFYGCLPCALVFGIFALGSVPQDLLGLYADHVFTWYRYAFLVPLVLALLSGIFLGILDGLYRLEGESVVPGPEQQVATKRS